MALFVIYIRRMSYKRSSSYVIPLVIAMVLSLLACSEDEGPNRSPDAPQSGLPPFAGRVEMPALRQDPMSLFIVHQTPVDGRDVINYSLEYDCLNRHARWVAFTFYDVTAKNSGSRTDAWDDDPDVPEQYRSGREDYRGYDRGHICASNDRKFTIEANVQTFYYSNMSPQYGNFNRGIWQRLEALVQDWGRNPSLRDTLYVVKGGTIDSDHIITYTGPSSVPVPAYYYMALVNVKKGIYSAIAFLLEHKDDYRAPYNLQDYAITVDELETFTGLDFFHNLPDACESRIEAQLVKDNWPGLFD